MFGQFEVQTLNQNECRRMFGETGTGSYLFIRIRAG